MHHALLPWLWEKQSPSFVTGPQTRIETGKAIIGEIVPQALKSYQHEGWDWLGGHLWPHALSWHEVALAIACQFPPAPGFPIPLFHQALLPGSFFLLLHLLLSIQTLHACYLPRMATINRKKMNLYCPASMAEVEGVQSCGIVSHHDGTDCWYFKGRKYLSLWSVGVDQKPQNIYV